MEGPKEKVIMRFLAMVQDHVQLKDAHLATLGGRGLEAALWSKAGVLADHGWLIELRRSLGNRLMEQYPYRMHNRLGTFHSIVKGHGENECIDGFHLDLCGTFNCHVVEDFSPALGIVLKSKARCLAISTADQRGNSALDKWSVLRKRAAKTLGVCAQHVFEELEDQQRRIPVKHDRPKFFSAFDPSKGAKRELSMLVEMAEMLGGHPDWALVHMERYIYVSRYETNPFRMRTYLFRFDRKSHTATPIEDLWISSPLRFYSGEAFEEIRIKSTKPRPQGKGLHMSSRLAEITKAMGGAEEAEYMMLLEKAKLFDNLLVTLKGTLNGSLSNTEAPAPRERTASRSKSTKPNGNGGHNAKAPRKVWKDLSDREQVEWLVRVLEMKAKKGKTFSGEAWKDLLKGDFGYYTKPLGKSLRAAIAHTSGKYRRFFIERIKKACGEDAPQIISRLPEARK